MDPRYFALCIAKGNGALTMMIITKGDYNFTLLRKRLLLLWFAVARAMALAISTV
jgi:hypothetical protein